MTINADDVRGWCVARILDLVSQARAELEPDKALDLINMARGHSEVIDAIRDGKIVPL